MDKVIYKKLKNKAVKTSHFFGRKLITVKYEDFKVYKKHFEECQNIFTRKQDFRTRGAIRHIHAIKEENLVEFHYDFGNYKRNILLSLVHFFADVIPFFAWHLVVWEKPYEINSF